MPKKYFLLLLLLIAGGQASSQEQSEAVYIHLPPSLSDNAKKYEFSSMVIWRDQLWQRGLLFRGGRSLTLYRRKCLLR